MQVPINNHLTYQALSVTTTSIDHLTYQASPTITTAIDHLAYQASLATSYQPCGFPYQVTIYINYEEWIKLLELKDQSIIQHISLIPKHLGFWNLSIDVVYKKLIKKPLISKTYFWHLQIIPRHTTKTHMGREARYIYMLPRTFLPSKTFNNSSIKYIS